jgi:IS605 OrfB family transposase
VLLVEEDAAFDAASLGPAPAVGVPARWAPCSVPRALVLRYTAGDDEKLPQPKAVKSVLTDWAKKQGFKKIRLAVLAVPDEAEIIRLQRAWDTRRGMVGSPVTLTYSVVLPREAQAGLGDKSASVDLQERLCWLSERCLPWMNQQLKELHREETLETAPGWARPVWKHGDLKAAPSFAPSRVGRCLQETIGRVVVSQGMRRQAFMALSEVFDSKSEAGLFEDSLYPLVLEAQAAWEAGHEGEKQPRAGFLLGVAEQMNADRRRRTEQKWNGSTWAEWMAFCGDSAPAATAQTYVELQRPPKMERLLLTYAADDGQRGQAARYDLKEDGTSLQVALLLPGRAEPAGSADWTWCAFQLALPDVAVKELARGGKLEAPDLRQRRDGPWVLDIKIQGQPKGTRKGLPKRVLAFDWGLRKLITAVVMEQDSQGQISQLTRPFFLTVGGLYAKLKELRAHASLLRSKADRLKNRRHRAEPAEQKVLAAEEQKTRAELAAVWRRYHELQDQLAHQAANFLLTLALESGCGVIAGEWLGSLKSNDKGHDLNWRINSQIRSVIIEKLKYKARRVGIKVELVWPRGTSHRCPRCRAEGQSIVDHPPKFQPQRKPGSYGRTPERPGTKHRPRRYSWFLCRECGFNGDRDYAAAVNIGNEYFAEIQARAGAKEEKLTGRRLAQAAKAHRQAVSYRGAAVARPFPSQNEWFPVLSGRHGERRQTTSIRQWSYHGGNLCGWRRRRVSVTPYAIRARFPSTA